MKKSLILVLGLLLLGCRAPMVSEEEAMMEGMEGEVVENVPAVEVEGMMEEGMEEEGMMEMEEVE
ncbi:hypothetical protein K9M41_03505 [Candidatus Gracilibacteria bacterium]|nr:hypothetical protein [Candidatus Gracilibacteria bacterium]